jgi:hypothetical protein
VHKCHIAPAKTRSVRSWHVDCYAFIKRRRLTATMEGMFSNQMSWGGFRTGRDGIAESFRKGTGGVNENKGQIRS